MTPWWLLLIAYTGGVVVTAAALLWAMTRTRTEAQIAFVQRNVMAILETAGEVDIAIGHRLSTLSAAEVAELERRVAEAVLGEEAG